MTPTHLPRVSIVTPSYNQSAFLGDTIRSVLNQDYPNLEYIIIDGGSTDGSVEIIRGFESRLAYWVSEQDAGQADAINKGWRRATGEIVAYLNSDDVYEPGAIRTAAEYLAAHPDTGMIYGHCYQLTQNGQRVGMLRALPFNLKTLLLHNGIMQATVFMRRSVLDGVGLLDTSLRHAMDYDLWLRIALRHRIDALSLPLAAFRAHAASKSFGEPQGFIRDLEKSLTRTFADPALPAELRALREQAMVNAYLMTILLCYGLDQETTGRALWEEMVQHFPQYDACEELVIELVANNAVHMVETPWLGAPGKDALGWLNEMLGDLPASADRLRRLAPRIVARIHTIHAFEAYWRRDYRGARAEISRTWRSDPSSLMNRGLLSIWLETVVGASVMNRWRQRRQARAR